MIPAGPVRIVVLAVAVLVCQPMVLRGLGGLAMPLARRLPIGRDRPRRDVDAAMGLVLAALAQGAVLGGLVVLTRVDLVAAITSHWGADLLAYGVALGVCEMGLTTFLCRTAIHLAIAIRARGSPGEPGGWLVVARGGWVQQYVRTVEVSPGPIAALTIFAYVAGEELIYRVVAIGYLLPLGVPTALTASIVLFAAAQVGGMPNWRSAMFPVISSVAVGLVHGLLFLSVPNVIPLIIAHGVFFASGVLGGGGVTARRTIAPGY